MDPGLVMVGCCPQDQFSAVGVSIRAQRTRHLRAKLGGVPFVLIMLLVMAVALADEPAVVSGEVIISPPDLGMSANLARARASAGGGSVVHVPSNPEAAQRLIDGNASDGWKAAEPFVEGKPVDRVLIQPQHWQSGSRTPREVEIGLSTESADAGFVSVGRYLLDDQPAFQELHFPAQPARYIKLTILSVHQPGRPAIAEIAVMAAGTTVASPPATPSPLARSESRHALVIAYNESQYPPTYYRITFTVKAPAEVGLWMLRESDGVDTVVLAQFCDIKRSLSETFKKALVAWVARGHKLIIQDSDSCGCPGPDYSFLPYPFATSNPGAQGANGISAPAPWERPLEHPRASRWQTRLPWVVHARVQGGAGGSTLRSTLEHGLE